MSIKKLVLFRPWKWLQLHLLRIISLALDFLTIFPVIVAFRPSKYTLLHFELDVRVIQCHQCHAVKRMLLLRQDLSIIESTSWKRCASVYLESPRIWNPQCSPEAFSAPEFLVGRMAPVWGVAGLKGVPCDSVVLANSRSGPFCKSTKSYFQPSLTLQRMLSLQVDILMPFKNTLIDSICKLNFFSLSIVF